MGKSTYEKYKKYEPPISGRIHSETRRTLESLLPEEPEAPQPTAAEVALQNRQREELAKLDEQENIRLKRGLRGQTGPRQLLSSVRSNRGRAPASTLSGAAPSSAGGGAPRAIGMAPTRRVSRPAGRYNPSGVSRSG